jgi:Asp-tRNA(Asn)/Glu-tRNA(Gln) amidotransferase A subunit family amidase
MLIADDRHRSMNAEFGDRLRPGAGREGSLAPLAGAVRGGRLSARQLVEESLRRIASADSLGAVVALRVDEALADAERLDAGVRNGSTTGPLAGLPLLVKDIEHAAGLRTTFGSLTRADDPPASRDGTVTARLRGAGAIVVGKTNVPEYALEGYTANRVFGLTRNPWSPEFSPGGSSGGSAAALAAGLAPIATATDVGGSVRIPAALCGLVGLKPTAGLIGRDPGLASLEINSHGPLTSSVADARLLLGILAGPVAGDPGALPPWRWERRVPPSRLLVATRLAAGPPVAAAVEAVFRAAVVLLSEALEATVALLDPDAVFPGGYDQDDWFRIVGVEQAHALGADLIEREADRFDPVFLSQMREALTIEVKTHVEARQRRYRYTRELDLLLGGDALLMTPTLTVDGWSADGRLPGEARPGLPGWVYNTEPPNLTGHPVICLPAGRLGDGRPVGFQLIGPRFGDSLLLDVAETWERVAPWPLVAPGYRPFALSDVASAVDVGPADAQRGRTDRE